jgi:hypothetical protein
MTDHDKWMRTQTHDDVYQPNSVPRKHIKEVGDNIGWEKGT